MNKYLGTTKCIKCGKEAKLHCGHVIGKDIGALGIPFDVIVLAGFCSEECHNSMDADPNGCFGSFNYYKHGKVKDCYEEMFGKREVNGSESSC